MSIVHVPSSLTQIVRAHPLLLLGLCGALLGCEPPHSTTAENSAAAGTNPSARRQGNVSVTTSTDTVQLGRLLNLRRFRPQRVQFHYTLVDNSGGLVSGPSDYRLEAVLWFDSLTFHRVQDAYASTNHPAPGLRREEFAFAWLPPAVRMELRTSRPAYTGDPDTVFVTGPSGQVWLLDRKVLVRSASH